MLVASQVWSWAPITPVTLIVNLLQNCFEIVNKIAFNPAHGNDEMIAQNQY